MDWIFAAWLLAGSTTVGLACYHQKGEWPERWIDGLIMMFLLSPIFLPMALAEVAKQRKASRIEAGTGETLQAAQPEGRAPSGQALAASGQACSLDPSGFDPSRLQAFWPIPINKDNEGLFCDLASEGAATGLLALVTGISEECWCASWMIGIEYELWRARENGPGGTYATQRQAELLRLLSDEAGGWWYWVEDQGPRFALLDSWRAHVAALAAGSRRAKTPQAVECEASQSGPKGNAQGDPA